MCYNPRQAIYVRSICVACIRHSLIDLHSPFSLFPRCTCAASAKCVSQMCENSYEYFRLKLSVLSHSVVIVIVYVSLPAFTSPSYSLSLSLFPSPSQPLNESCLNVLPFQLKIFCSGFGFSLFPRVCVPRPVSGSSAV